MGYDPKDKIKGGLLMLPLIFAGYCSKDPFHMST